MTYNSSTYDIMGTTLHKEAVVTREQRAYVAGFFDGEGCVSARSTRPPYGLPILYITMGQRHPRIIQEIQEMLGFGRVTKHKSYGKYFYKLNITNREDARRFIKLLYPYARVKKRQLKVAYELAGLIGKHNLVPVSPAARERRWELAQQLKDLKN